METLSKKLKEVPDVSSQMENGTPTKAKRMRKCISLLRRKKQLFPKSRFKTVVQPETLLSISKGYTPSNTLKNTELTMKNFELGWSREIQEQQLLVKTLVLSISYRQLIILTSLDGFLCLFLKLDILMDHYIHLKLSTSFCVGCYCPRLQLLPISLIELITHLLKSLHKFSTHGREKSLYTI